MDGATFHRAFESLWRRLFDAIEGASWERRPGLSLYRFPPLPIAQFNGPWVEEDSADAVEALPSALAEVENTGARVWVQTRASHERVRDAARALGLTHVERVPALLARAGELRQPDCELRIDEVEDADLDEVNDLLAEAFAMPPDVFELLNGLVRPLDWCSWYAARVDGELAATAVGATGDGAVGVFNVATAPRHRRRGYGAALTAHAARGGFASGAELAFLQTSELGHGVYRGLGFREVEEYVLLTRPF